MLLAVQTNPSLPIYTPRRIAETPMIWLRCVDSLCRKGLRLTLDRLAQAIYTIYRRCVESQPSNLCSVWSPRRTPYRLGQIGLVGNRNSLLPDLLERPSQPYRLGQIGLVGNTAQDLVLEFLQNYTLPIRSNRISWKPFELNVNKDFTLLHLTD